MIDFATYDPIPFLLKTTFEFDDNKVKIKGKSLTTETETEIDYDRVACLDFQEIGDATLSSFGFFTIIITTFVFVILSVSHLIDQNDLVVYTLGRIASIVGIASYAWAYKTNLYCLLRNTEDEFLGGIKITPGNQKQVFKALSLITQKIKKIKEISPFKPLPRAKPNYQIMEHNTAKGIKFTTMFYKDKLIVIRNSLFSKSSYEANYSELNGKMFRIKRLSKDWFEAGLTSMTLGSCLMFMAYFIFLLPANKLILQGCLGLMAILFSPSLLSLIKEEFVGFYDKQDKLVYAARITSKNRETIEHVIQFVQSRINPKQSKKSKTGAK
jgi:hypothetical protein